MSQPTPNAPTHTPKPRFTMIVAVHLALINTQEEVLLSRRFQTGFADGLYSLPAGHVDGNESVIAAMIRETQEEIGLTLTPQQLQFGHVMHRVTDAERIDFFFVCREWTGMPKIGEPDKCDELRWALLDDLPSHTIPYIKLGLESIKNQQPFSLLGW